MRNLKAKVVVTLILSAAAPVALMAASAPRTIDGAVRVATPVCRHLDACDAAPGRCESTNGYHLGSSDGTLGAVVTEVAMETSSSSRVVAYASR